MRGDIDLLGEHLFSIDLFQPWVLEHIFNIVLGAKALLWVLLKEFEDEVLAAERDADVVFGLLLSVGEIWVTIKNHFAKLLQIVVAQFSNVKGRETDEHFICQDSQRPPIN